MSAASREATDLLIADAWRAKEYGPLDMMFERAHDVGSSTPIPNSKEPTMHSLQSIRNINHWAAERAAAARANQTSGHHADGSSIQKHSAGPDYPFVVFEQGENAVTHVMYGDVDVTAGSRDTARAIIAAASQIKRVDGCSYGEALTRAAPMFGRWRNQPKAA